MAFQVQSNPSGIAAKIKTCMAPQDGDEKVFQHTCAGEATAFPDLLLLSLPRLMWKKNKRTIELHFHQFTSSAIKS